MKGGDNDNEFKWRIVRIKFDIFLTVEVEEKKTAAVQDWRSS